MLMEPVGLKGVIGFLQKGLYGDNKRGLWGLVYEGSLVAIWGSFKRELCIGFHERGLGVDTGQV